jgi:muramidase (phage lysozyme)
MIGDNGLDNLTWFMGLVEEVDYTNTARIKVRCFGFHPSVASNTVDTQDLPWASVMRTGSTFYDHLEKGELVFGFFLDGRDAQQPIVIGAISTAKYSVPYMTQASFDPNANSSNGLPINTGTAQSTTLNSTQKAFLDAISSHESGGAYDVLNGGQQFNNSNPHPDVVGNGGSSTAAGRYQFLYKTWLLMNGNVNVPMTPENQDNAAWKLASKQYSSATGKDLLTALTTNGLTPDILSSLSSTWTSLSSNQDSIISTYNKSLSGSLSNSNPIQGMNEYMKPSQQVVDNYGNSALPAQMSGHNIDQTPILTQVVARKNTTVGGFVVSEPNKPYSGDATKSSVWQTRQHGSYVELSGKDPNEEFISISHVSGSHVVMDSQGNVTIKSFGKSHHSSENDSEDIVAGTKLASYGGGYVLSITGGTCAIHSVGDMSISTGGNLAISSAGKLTINAGDSIEMAGSKIAATARVDSVDIMAINKLSIQSSAGTVNILSKGDLSMSSGANINMNATGGNLVADASGTIRLADPSVSPTAPTAAVQADVPKAIAKEISTPTNPDPNPPMITHDLLDESISA